MIYRMFLSNTSRTNTKHFSIYYVFWKVCRIRLSDRISINRL
jgi:hypothetical protein